MVLLQLYISTVAIIILQGVLTECVLPGAGLYRLDNGVMLYITHRHSLDGGRGLRPGAMLELFNVHPMRLPPPLQSASGFWCCAKSTVHIFQFSHNSVPFKASEWLTRVCSLIIHLVVHSLSCREISCVVS